MNYKKIIKREDGRQYEINVCPFLRPHQMGAITYNVSIHYREKGKRKWLPLPDNKNYWEYRSLSLEERIKHNKENMLRFVTKEEIHQAKLECWEQLKPKMDN